MIVIGGLGTVRGSLLGAAFVTLLPIVLRGMMQPLESLVPGSTSELVSNLQLVLFGVVIVAFMLLQPRGLASLRMTAWVRRGPAVGAACVRRTASVAPW
jgi:branched-chain amino acid transport system permease protein